MNVVTILRTGTAALCAGLVVAGCAPREDVLPGPRYDLRDLDGAEAVLASATEVPVTGEPPQPQREIPAPPYMVAGEAQAIRLPGAQRVASWPQAGQNAQHQMPHAQLRNGPLTRVWSTDFGAGNAQRLRLSAAPVSDGSRVFVLDSEMAVSAVSAATGAVIWRRDLVPAGESAGEALGGGLAVVDGELYVTTGFGELTVLDAASGTPRWTQRFAAAAVAPPVVSGGLVYVVTRDGLGSAIDSGTGRIIWQTEGMSDAAAVLGAGAPVIAGSSVVFPSGDGALTALLREGGVNLWSSSVSGGRTGRAYAGIGGIPGGPVVAGDTVFVATGAGRMAAIDAASGARLWTALEGGTGPVAVAGGSLFVVSDEAKLLRLDAGDGSLIWAATLPLYETEKVRKRESVYVHYGPILAGGRLVLVSSDGRLREVDPRSGALLRVTDLGASAAVAPIVVAGTLYVVTADGVLQAWR